MPGSAHLSFALAGLLGAGGIGGYAKAASMPSLVVGLGCGGAFAASGVLIQRGEDRLGHGVALATSVPLCVAMGARAASTGKLMPAGVVALVAGLSSAYQAKKFNEWSE